MSEAMSSEKNAPHPEFMTFKDFEQNAKPSTLFADAVEDLRKERESQVIDKEYVETNETWNMLAHQVVGQERF
jgi:hypothetical protein